MGENNNTVEKYKDDNIDLRELFTVVWAGKWPILGITIIAAIGSVIAAINLPNIYRSQALLVPYSNDGGISASRIAAQYGGLASFAGISLNGIQGGTDSTTIALEILKSREFFRKYLYEEFLIELMAVKGWDEADGLLIDDKAYDSAKRIWVRDSPNPKPTLLQAHRRFSSKHLTIAKDSQTGLVEIGIEHLSPVVASKWVKRIVQRINTARRESDMENARKSIEYLLAEQKKTSIVSLVEVFFQLIEEQTKAMMLANVSEEYVFTTIEPSVVSDIHIKPNRKYICMVSTLLGAITGFLLVLIRYYAFKKT